MIGMLLKTLMTNGCCPLKGLNNMRAAGIEPLRVDVDINELLAWCKAKGVKNTGEYRAEFIAELSRQGRSRKIK
jgi:hypothetical protein